MKHKFTFCKPHYLSCDVAEGVKQDALSPDSHPTGCRSAIFFTYENLSLIITLNFVHDIFIDFNAERKSKGKLWKLFSPEQEK